VTKLRTEAAVEVVAVAVGEGKGSGMWTDHHSSGRSPRKLERPKVGTDRAVLKLEVGRLGTVGTASGERPHQFWLASGTRQVQRGVSPAGN